MLGTAVILVSSLALLVLTLGSASKVLPSALIRRMNASPSLPLPALRLMLTRREGCNDWPPRELHVLLELLNVDMESLGWRCLHSGQVDEMPFDALLTTRDDCKAWCQAAHPPNQYRLIEAEQANAAGRGWCCEWRAKNGGQCTWSDGTPRLTHTTSCSSMAGPAPEDDRQQDCTRPLAFGICPSILSFELVRNGGCLDDRTTLIEHVNAESLEDCSRRCDRHAYHALPNGSQCRAFGWNMQMHGRRGRQHRGTGRQCVLLRNCEVRLRARHSLIFYARPVVPV